MSGRCSLRHQALSYATALGLGGALVLQPPALAADTSFPFLASLTKQLWNDHVAENVISVAVIGEPDRKTLVDYQKEHADRFPTLEALENEVAATGTLECPWIYMTAQLTGANDILTTAAHAVAPTGEAKCESLQVIRHCTFVYKVRGEKRRARMDRIVGTGYECLGPGKTSKNDRFEDWAVLKLEQPINDVQPYAVDPNAADIVRNQKITHVGAQAADFGKKLGNGFQSFGKYLGDCKVGKIWKGKGTTKLFASDCDGSEGSSGSGVFARGVKAEPSSRSW